MFHPTETVEVIRIPCLYRTDGAHRDKLQPKIQTSVTYVARMVALGITPVELSDGALVQTRTFEFCERDD